MYLEKFSQWNNEISKSIHVSVLFIFTYSFFHTNALKFFPPIRIMQIRTTSTKTTTEWSRSHLVQCKKPADELKFSTRSRKRIRIEIATTKTKAEQRIAKSKDNKYLREKEKNATIVQLSLFLKMNAFWLDAHKWRN